MGCDIHIYPEAVKNNKWVFVDVLTGDDDYSYKFDCEFRYSTR